MSILDYLNEDCWLAVLQYVPAQELIRTERTCRLWQRWVLMYLKGVRISVVDEENRPKERHSHACTLKLARDAYESFAMWTYKVGTSVVAAYCINLETLKIINENCPNLERLMFVDMPDTDEGGLCPYNLNKDFKRLQGLQFYSCCVSEKFIIQFIADTALEELEIRGDNCNVTGNFLNTINLSNLKSLALEFLEFFNIEHLDSAVDQLSELTKLVLVDMPFETSEGIQYVVDKLKKLEYLELYYSDWMSCYDYEPMSRLARLKYLRTSFRVPDEGVEAILEGCKELETLELLDCRTITDTVSGPFCRHGSRLRSLTLHKVHCMGDDDLVAIISSCPELTSLVVSAADLSPALPARAAAARRAARPGVRLRLDLSDTILAEPDKLKERYGNYVPMKTDYEDLIIDLTLSYPALSKIPKMPFFSGRCLSTAKLVGTTAVITGCSSGIGKETALDFYKRGARVIMACRDLEKAAVVKSEIEEKCKHLPETGKLVLVKCDLASLKSVRECAETILNTEQQIKILVNNAGVMMCPKSYTEDGFEMQFGTNHLAHFLLTLLLLPRMRSSTPARIVTVSSGAHIRSDINFDDLNYKNRSYSPTKAYSQSKLANVLFSKELASKLKEHTIDGIHTYSLHPGVIKTELVRHLDDSFFWGARGVIGMISPFFKSPELGAQTTIYCSVDEKCAEETGLYYSDCVVKTPSRKALNDEYAKKLWEVSMDLVGLKNYNPFTAEDSAPKQN